MKKRLYIKDLEPQIRELLGYGMTDREIGARLSLSPSGICKFRVENGIPANTKHHWKLPEEDAMLTELYERKLSDKKIALESGYSTTTIKAWRDWHGFQVWSKREAGVL